MNNYNHQKSVNVAKKLRRLIGAKIELNEIEIENLHLQFNADAIEAGSLSEVLMFILGLFYFDLNETSRDEISESARSARHYYDKERDEYFVHAEKIAEQVVNIVNKEFDL